MENNLVVNGKLRLYGMVGETFWEAGFTDAQVLDALDTLDGPLDVNINSGGGYVFHGSAIYNALRTYSQTKGKVTVYVDGYALSAASLIAMAGDEIVMRQGSFMMIHKAGQMTFGDEAAHEKSAGILRIHDAEISRLYANRTGLSETEVLDMMAVETWMNGADAVAKGFADRTETAEAEEATAFNYSLYSKAPASLQALASMRQWTGVKLAAPSAAQPVRKEITMTVTKDAADNIEPAVETTNAQATSAAIKAERKRVTEITAVGTSAGFPKEEIDKYLEAGTSVQAFKAAVWDWKAANAVDANQPQINAVVTHDVVDRFIAGATKAVMAKAGLKGGERNEFSSMGHVELARKCLEVRGTRVTSSSPLDVLGAAMRPTMAGGTHTIGDFPSILADVANKSMLKGFEETEETFSEWTSKGSAPDFKKMNRVDMNLYPSLKKVEEGAEYKYATIGDRGTTIQVATYGGLFSISRQALVGDSTDSYAKIPQRMGRAAKRTIADLVYAVLTTNPLMGDGIALFNAAHSNLAAAGTAISMTSVEAGRAAMALQKDPDGVASSGLNIRPAFMLVPVEQYGKAAQLVAAEYDPATTQKSPNIVRNSVKVISEARLSSASALSWYLAANGSTNDTIEVCYLNGVDTPWLESREGWSIDGVEFKVRIDAGVAALDHRGLYKNPGA